MEFSIEGVLAVAGAIGSFAIWLLRLEGKANAAEKRTEEIAANDREIFARLNKIESVQAQFDPMKDQFHELRQDLAILDKDSRAHAQDMAGMKATIDAMRNDIRTLSHDVRTMLGILSARAMDDSK